MIGLLADTQIAAAEVADEAARATYSRAAMEVCVPAKCITVQLLGTVINSNRPVGEAAGDPIPLQGNIPYTRSEQAMYNKEWWQVNEK